MNKTKKISFVYTLPTSFVTKDIENLKSIGHQVFEITSPPFKNFFLFFNNRIREFFKGFFLIPKSNCVIIWFSDYHGLIPLVIAKIFSIKSIVIVGGYDAISDKEIDHGIFSKNNLRQKIARMNFNLATNIWVVDETLSKGCKKAFIQNNINSGLINWMPNLEKKIKVVPTGYSSTFWKKTKLKLPNTVLTVANFNDSRVLKLKGIPIILKLAKELPEFNFIILGLKTQSIISADIKPPNVETIKSKNKMELREYFSENQFYIQASRLEGLPNALCEAMLCECIPIGNAVFGIPKVIGNTGLLFNGEKDFKRIKKFLRGKNQKSGTHARQQIINFFDKEKRIEELKKIWHEHKTERVFVLSRI